MDMRTVPVGLSFFSGEAGSAWELIMAGASMATATERVLRDRITAGLVSVKDGHTAALRRIELNECGHPVPDEGCVRGCERILEVIQGLRPEDLVFTIAANGVSSLLTLPVPGVDTPEDAARMRKWFDREGICG